MDPDLELLDRWCGGETQAGNTLFRRHFRSIYCFFEHKAQPDVDELVQDTFLACVKARDRFERRSSFRTYLFSIARHILYEYWRRRARRGEKLDFSESSLADLATTPRSRIARQQDRAQLLLALRQLPLEQQLLLELHYWEDMSGKELAEVFDIAPATTRSRLFRARQALREKLNSTDAAAGGEAGNLEAWVRSLHENDNR